MRACKRNLSDETKKKAFINIIFKLIQIMDLQSIGESAGVVWNLLATDNKKMEYQELKEASGLNDKELSAAMGWLASEGKLQISKEKVGRKQVMYIALA